ncbi:Gfo/Idh/MocA family oxidoreductase [candidate division KSB1 bacterium]|nr:Gfo/Idh/MocA family oxidoreductase [candidate division KSB1 bacterium]
MKKVSWGIISTANIGIEKVIPAMQKGTYSEIKAIASRNREKAQQAAQKLGIPKAYGSYEQLLEDPEIEAVYNPLPNHLHVDWTIKSLEAGKHVLCEKPIGLNCQQAEHLKEEMKKHPDLKVMEAFMYRFHPQWQSVKKMIDRATIGEIRNIHSVFSYCNIDPSDVRNQFEIGGGGLLDIGCYCISLSRFLFNNEPVRVCGAIERDPEMEIDRLASAVLEFERGTSTFTCSTQLTGYQHVLILGTDGRIEMETPFTPSPDSVSKIMVQVGSQTKEIVFEPCNQYTIQGDLFSQAILNDTDVPTSIEDGIANMKVIDRIKESHQRGIWISI